MPLQSGRRKHLLNVVSRYVCAAVMVAGCRLQAVEYTVYFRLRYTAWNVDGQSNIIPEQHTVADDSVVVSCSEMPMQGNELVHYFVPDHGGNGCVCMLESEMTHLMLST